MSPEYLTPGERRVKEWLAANPDKAATIARRTRDAEMGINMVSMTDCPDGPKVNRDLLEESDIVFEAFFGSKLEES